MDYHTVKYIQVNKLKPKKVLTEKLKLGVDTPEEYMYIGQIRSNEDLLRT